MKRLLMIAFVALLVGQQASAKKYNRLFLWVDETITVADRQKLLPKIRVIFHDNAELTPSKLPKGTLSADPSRTGRYVCFNIEALKHKWTKAKAKQWVLNNISEPGKIKVWLGDSIEDTGIVPE